MKVTLRHIAEMAATQPTRSAGPFSCPAGMWPPLESLRPDDSPFVEPTLTPVSTMTGVPDIVLVMAAAAAGKSRFARRLATETSNPLIDLANDLQVGANYFRGGLSRALRNRSYDGEMALRSGKATLIIDSLDEALVAAGLDNFRAAISDLIDIVRSDESRSHSGAILLGRHDAIEYAALVAGEVGASWCLYSIDLFSANEQEQFVNTIATSRFPGMNARHFETVVREILRLLRRMLGDNLAEQQSFLGYPPVLSAIASLGEAENLYSRVARIQRTTDRRDVWPFLGRIAHEILDRERSKIVAAAGEKEKNLVDRLYSPEMQVRYLCRDDLTDPRFEIDESLPDESIARVRGLVVSQLEVHPFITTAAERNGSPAFSRFVNVVFRDYVAARALASGDEESCLAVIEGYSADDVTPSPLLVRLLLSMTTDGAGDDTMDVVTLDSSAMGIVCDSAATEIKDEHAYRWIGLHGDHIDARDSDTPNGIIRLSVTENDDGLGVIEIAVTSSHRVVLGRAISHAYLNFFDLEVETGAGATFEFIPPVTINADRFWFRSETSMLVRHDTEEIVRINARSVGGGYRDIPIAREELLITTDGAEYPWRRFRAGDFLPNSAVRRETIQAARQLRRVLNSCVKSHDDGTYHLTEDRYAWLARRAQGSETALQFLREKGLIRKKILNLDYGSRTVYALDVAAYMHGVWLFSLEGEFGELTSQYEKWLTSKRAFR